MRIFWQRIRKIAACQPKGIILREKDLSEAAYKALAENVMQICKQNDVPCILHSFIDAALLLGAEQIHLPLHILRGMEEEKKETVPKHRRILPFCCGKHRRRLGLAVPISQQDTFS